MVSEYHVPADAAFFLSRSLYSYEINVSLNYTCVSAKLCLIQKQTAYFQFEILQF